MEEGVPFHATVAQMLSLTALGPWEGHFPVLSLPPNSQSGGIILAFGSAL